VVRYCPFLRAIGETQSERDKHVVFQPFGFSDGGSTPPASTIFFLRLTIIPANKLTEPFTDRCRVWPEGAACAGSRSQHQQSLPFSAPSTAKPLVRLLWSPLTAALLRKGSG